MEKKHYLTKLRLVEKEWQKRIHKMMHRKGACAYWSIHARSLMQSMRTVHIYIHTYIHTYRSITLVSSDVSRS
jgi:hypothetical protein